MTFVLDYVIEDVVEIMKNFNERRSMIETLLGRFFTDAEWSEFCSALDQTHVFLSGC